MSMALIPAPLREWASGAQWVAVPGPRHAHLAIRQERVLDVPLLHVLDEQGPAALDQSRLAHLNEMGGVSGETEIGAAYCGHQRVAARHCVANDALLILQYQAEAVALCQLNQSPQPGKRFFDAVVIA